MDLFLEVHVLLDISVLRLSAMTIRRDLIEDMEREGAGFN
jgi:hypothetical protein